MSDRPRIKLKLTITDKLIEFLAFLGLVILWMLTFSGYSNLPEIIPTHFNGSGEVDAYGSKDTLFALPIIATVLFTGLTILNKFPHLFSYPTEITLENAEKQYYIAAKLMRFLKLVVIIIFTLIVYKTQETVTGKSEGLGTWFLPLTLGLTFVPILFYLIESFRNQK